MDLEALEEGPKSCMKGVVKFLSKLSLDIVHHEI